MLSSSIHSFTVFSGGVCCSQPELNATFSSMQNLSLKMIMLLKLIHGTTLELQEIKNRILIRWRAQGSLFQLPDCLGGITGPLTVITQPVSC